MQSMLKITVAAGKGQLLKASSRAVPMLTVSDISEPASVDHSVVVPKGTSSTYLTDFSVSTNFSCI